MQDIKIELQIGDGSVNAVSYKNGKKSLEISKNDSTLCVLAYYDFNERPLALSANVKSGDKAEIVFLDYRIELCKIGRAHV